MPSPAHETLVALLQHRPELLDLLLQSLGFKGFSSKFVAKDSAVRVANPLEMRPDLVLFAEDDSNAWMIVEVQLSCDDDKQRRWLAAAGALLDARGVMGDVVVITHDASVARWASEIAKAVGPKGTRLGLEPVVVPLTATEAEGLVTTGRGELAMFAAWAVHDQRGKNAQELVRKAVVAIDAIGDAELRDTLTRAMLSMLGEPLLAVIEEMMMDRAVIPESPGYRALKRKIEALGEARALLTVLGARGLEIDSETRERIERCIDPDVINGWIERAATASSLGEVFGITGDAE